MDFFVVSALAVHKDRFRVTPVVAVIVVLLKFKIGSRWGKPET